MIIGQFFASQVGCIQTLFKAFFWRTLRMCAHVFLLSIREKINSTGLEGGRGEGGGCFMAPGKK